MKKQILIILLLVLTFFSCKQDKEIVSNDIINKLSDGNYKRPSINGTLNLFVLSDNQDVIVTNTDYLNYVYDSHYKNKFKNYSEFLTFFLNHKEILSKNDFDSIPYKSFKLNKTIGKQYHELKFKEFFKKHVKKNNSKEDSYTLNVSKDMSYDEIMTISYYLYLNGYQTMRNDYFPNYIVIKIDKIIKK